MHGGEYEEAGPDKSTAGSRDGRHAGNPSETCLPPFSGLLSVNAGSFRPEGPERMAYKLDGAKFPTIEDLIEALYPLYADKMSEEEFRKYVEENAEKS